MLESKQPLKKEMQKEKREKRVSTNQFQTEIKEHCSIHQNGSEACISIKAENSRKHPNKQEGKKATQSKKRIYRIHIPIFQQKVTSMN